MKKILTVFFLACLSCAAMAQDNVIDEIVWVVGDDAILRSDVETQRLYMQNEGERLDGDPYCVIPERIAIQKLYLNQAKIDLGLAAAGNALEQYSFCRRTFR